MLLPLMDSGGAEISLANVFEVTKPTSWRTSDWYVYLDLLRKDSDLSWWRLYIGPVSRLCYFKDLQRGYGSVFESQAQSQDFVTSKISERGYDSVFESQACTDLLPDSGQQ